MKRLKDILVKIKNTIKKIINHYCSNSRNNNLLNTSTERNIIQTSFYPLLSTKNRK